MDCWLVGLLGTQRVISASAAEYGCRCPIAPTAATTKLESQQLQTMSSGDNRQTAGELEEWVAGNWELV